MTTTIQTSSLTNRIAMTLMMELRRLTCNPRGFHDAQAVVREHAEQIVKDFQGSLLGGWVTPGHAMPRDSKHASTAETLSNRIIRDLHRHAGAPGRVDVDTAIRLRIGGLVAAFVGDWPHFNEFGEPLDINGEPAPAR